MGCNESKVEDLPLVVRCRERRELIRTAANHRYSLAAAHVSYLLSLKHVGNALCKFFDEELITTSPSISSSSSPFSSPSTFPRNLHNRDREDQEHSHKGFQNQDQDEEFSSNPNYHYRTGEFNGQGFWEGMGNDPFMYLNPLHYTSSSSNAYYMNNSAPTTKTVFPDTDWASATGNTGGVKLSPQKKPAVSPFGDFFNSLFDGGGYSDGGRYEYVSNSGSPDLSEVRKREGIPELEEETDSELYTEEFMRKRRMKDVGDWIHEGDRFRSEAAPPLYRNRGGNLRNRVSEKPSKPPLNCEEFVNHSMPPCQSRVNSRVDQCPEEKMGGLASFIDEKLSADNVTTGCVDDGHVKKRGVNFEVEGASKKDDDSPKLSSVSLLYPHDTRNLREVVAEIRDEFDTASSIGKEVAMMLEVGKMPYQPSFLKILISRILYLISPSLSPLKDPPSLQSAKLASRTVKLAKSYFEDVGKDVNAKAYNLSLILDKLYAWEQKLYKEVKEEERFRVLFKKQCKRLKILNQQEAESTKINAAQAYHMRLMTKLDVSIKAIDAISRRIHKLRDEELQPQIAALIQGLIRMWQAMMKCHQKQFQAITKSKMRKLKAKTGLQEEPRSRALIDLENELHAWCESFNNWISFQKSYVESLNGWLLQCIHDKPQDILDRTVPYSPGQHGAPPIFVLCNDWHHAMEAISKTRVAKAINTFRISLRKLWEKHDQEGRQRLRAEYVSKDYEKQLRILASGKSEGEETKMSRKGGLYGVPSESEISPLDYLKVDLDLVKQRLIEERVKHKDAMKLVHHAASSSLQGGLIPIFKALESFTSESLKAYEHVRLQHPEQGL